jgi:hypothetical protein
MSCDVLGAAGPVDADGDISITMNEGEETPEAQALAQGWFYFISLSFHAY